MSIADFRPYLSAPLIIATYQTSHCYHGNDDANHHYCRYPQAGPVTWAVKVDMIMVMRYCPIPIVYHSFIHG